MTLQLAGKFRRRLFFVLYFLNFFYLRTSSISTLEDAERQHILRALRQTEWRIAGPKGAAAILGMKRTTLQARMRKLGIRRPV